MSDILSPEEFSALRMRLSRSNVSFEGEQKISAHDTAMRFEIQRLTDENKRLTNNSAEQRAEIQRLTHNNWKAARRIYPDSGLDPIGIAERALSQIAELVEKNHLLTRAVEARGNHESEIEVLRQDAARLDRFQKWYNDGYDRHCMTQLDWKERPVIDIREFIDGTITDAMQTWDAAMKEKHEG